MKTLIELVATPEALIIGLYKAKPETTSYKYKKEWDLLQANHGWAEPMCCNLLNRSYQFGEPEYLEIDGKRPILLIKAQDRALEQTLLAVTDKYLRAALAFPNTYARNALPDEDKKSLQGLAREIGLARLEKPFVFETDIKKFFPRIQNKILVESMDRYLPDSTLNFLFTQIVERRPPARAKVSENLKELFIDIDRGIPQGSCMSPILASLYLEPLDRMLTDQKLKYFRYVDDLVIFANSISEAAEAESIVHAKLEALGLCAHKSFVEADEKGHIRAEDQPLSFVGFDFIPPAIVQPQDKAIKKFEARVAEIGANARTLRELLNQLANFTRGWEAAYSACNLPLGLKKKLDKHQILAVRQWSERNKVLARSYSQFPMHSQALALGIELLNNKSKKKSSGSGVEEFLTELTVEEVVDEPLRERD